MTAPTDEEKIRRLVAQGFAVKRFGSVWRIQGHGVDALSHDLTLESAVELRKSRAVAAHQGEV